MPSKKEKVLKSVIAERSNMTKELKINMNKKFMKDVVENKQPRV